MIIKSTPTYKLTFSEQYVIAEANEGAVVNNESVAEALKIILDHFNGRSFTVISHRKNQYKVDLDVYSLKLMNKIQALAIVSSDSTVKENALAEQLAFNRSFAFFQDIEDAIGWAENVVI